MSAPRQAPARPPGGHRPAARAASRTPSHRQLREDRDRGRLAASRLARTRARAQMMRRRRRTVMIGFLVVITAAWFWQVTHRPSALAGGPAGWSASTAPSPAPSDPPPAASAKPVTVVPGHVAVVTAGDGRLTVVPGTGKRYGTGPLKRYIVEVEGGLGEDAAAFAAFVEHTLGDPRSWTHGGAVSLQRVDSGPVSFRVTLASPRTVDRYCAPLNTNGYTSCFDSRGRAMLNQARWENGVPWYASDMTTYRQYMVNHEVGHGLGHQHLRCPRAGALAPTMQQQTLGMQGCRHNAWPYP
ncbi:MAG: DUF3152 domain-containing protein [Actinomycetota bacterium]|nr:DUF3152 domain-containing protein [Actinomycetota bacterium]